MYWGDKMAHVRNGWNTFLEVTTVHGFRYLGSRQGLATKVAWAREHT